jgi:hypothetical protein
MSFHPAFPSAGDLSREAHAITRDREDLASLATLHRIIAAALAQAGRVDPIRHPDRKWQTDELTEALEEQLANIDDTASMIRGCPVVIEDQETA